VESRTRIDLPPHVEEPYEVFVNGVPQERGRDFDVVGRTLVFRTALAREGRLGFWRWASLFLGVAGTYRKNDSVDIVHQSAGRRTVTTVQPVASGAGDGSS
jgi:hypothetical protein